MNPTGLVYLQSFLYMEHFDAALDVLSGLCFAHRKEGSTMKKFKQIFWGINYAVAFVLIVLVLLNSAGIISYDISPIIPFVVALSFGIQAFISHHEGNQENFLVCFILCLVFIYECTV